jgi:hypothetical protein
VPSEKIKAKKEPGEAEVEPIKPDDASVSRKGSLLGTCYPISTEKKNKIHDIGFREPNLSTFNLIKHILSSL